VGPRKKNRHVFEVAVRLWDSGTPDKADRCCHQITEVDQTRIMLKIILEMKNNKHHFYSDVVKKLSF
jgi:hypothetical protein